MKIRNIPRSSILYAKRAKAWRTDSFPFLSGDLFAKNSDVSVYPPKFRSRNPTKSEIAGARVIFCPSHMLETFLDEHGSIVNCKLLILGNSDRDFSEPIEGLPPTIKNVLCQNLSFADPRYHVMPIGIENSRLATNGIRSLFANEFLLQEKELKVLVGPMSMTHSERYGMDSLLNGDSRIVFQNSRLAPAEYAEIASKFRFIAAPRGNGLDTHRFWESLYRGSVPLVMESTWADSIKKLGVPLSTVRKWDKEEILFSIERDSCQEFIPSAIPQLWWPWWRERITSWI